MNSPDDQVLDEMAKQVRATIRTGNGHSPRQLVGWMVAAAAAMALVAWWLWPSPQPVPWQTLPVDRGDMVLTATATGNLEPKSEVTVGAEISGLIEEVYVAENDVVEQGMVLARFDTEELEVNLRQAEARLALAKASVEEAEATLAETAADQHRKQELVARNMSSQADLESAIAARDRAVAKLSYAHAAVHEAEAAVSMARTRLDKAVITSPINGVVLRRNVEPGNTVAANFQTPELFLLAEDLRRMELHVSLDEADVGMVKAGQAATFTVDAWPDREFKARVLTVYLYPTVENNVVSYTTVLGVDNRESVLQPGMTATATIFTGHLENIMRVPNVALRFTPADEHERRGIFSGPPRDRDSAPGNSVWVLRDGVPQRVAVHTGATDGRYTEVTSDELKPGDPVLVGTLAASGD